MQFFCQKSPFIKSFALGHFPELDSGDKYETVKTYLNIVENHLSIKVNLI